MILHDYWVVTTLLAAKFPTVLTCWGHSDEWESGDVLGWLADHAQEHRGAYDAAVLALMRDRLCKL